MLESLSMPLHLVESSYRFGLAWSELKTGHIISSGEDTTVCKWLVSHPNFPDNSTLRPYVTGTSMPTAGWGTLYAPLKFSSATTAA